MNLFSYLHMISLRWIFWFGRPGRRGNNPDIVVYRKKLNNLPPLLAEPRSRKNGEYGMFTSRLLYHRRAKSNETLFIVKCCLFVI